MSLPRYLITPKVEYGGVNFIDTYFRAGLYKFEKFPAVLGKEIAGIIVALPTDEKASSLAEKSLVWVVSYSFRGQMSDVRLLGVVSPVPESVSTRTAAAALLQGLTAVSFVEEAYPVKKGDTILIHTAAGGLGLLLTQLAKNIGATVIGTTSTAAKAELAKANGADHVILYPVEDTVKRVLEITNGVGVDGVFDGVGKDTFDNNFKLIKRKGTIVSVGNASGAVEPFSVLRLAEKNLSLLRPSLSNYVYTPEESAYYSHKLFALVAKGALKIAVFEEYPFTAEGVQKAQRDLTGGKTTGKLVVKIAQ
ncbi:hypothetical protein K443DRAFT_104850 [Laccaria amethystina LaAM-08-1]|uniref:Probable quinone oxidoreductase n=1 Tax=Laccaria amethystina LaAM-08-1 TaxID=1095629 RepID=A0A0C9WM76_9AGAR|nr:hypothetical protein K443DRAFT_104850 [Laccaria amethystina LaAM-08-1]